MDVDQAMTAIVNAGDIEAAMRIASMLKRATLLELADQMYLNDYEEMKRKKLIKAVVSLARGVDSEPVPVMASVSLELFTNEWLAIARLLEFARDGITPTDDVPAADFTFLAGAITALVKPHCTDAALLAHGF